VYLYQQVTRKIGPKSDKLLARIIHRLSSRSGGSAGGSALRHVATEPPAGVLLQYAEEVAGYPLAGRGYPRPAALRVAQSGRMIPPLQQTVCELSGLTVRASHRLAPYPASEFWLRGSIFCPSSVSWALSSVS